VKKISVNKSDEIAIIVEKIIDTPDDEVVLSIPRFSHLGESLSNFHLLKREAEALEKKITIESVDDHVIELAEMSGLTAANPFFAKSKRQFSDIVAPKAGSSAKTKKRKVPVLQEAAAEEEVPTQRIPAQRIPTPIRSMNEERDAYKFDLAELERSASELEKTSRFAISMPAISLPRFRGSFLWWGVGVLALGFIAFAAATILPRASVVIEAQTQEWSYNDSVVTDKAAVTDVAKMTVPNQVFTQKNNVQLKFPATGRRQVERKAGGTITVYNSYSSDPQPLVEQTRFMTPDGKVFRLPKTITVPGAKIIEGKIVPSSIETQVVADQAGPDYNIGPVKLFTIPGFKGTPKYQSFYAESKSDMTGGFIGEIAYPTDEDARSAKAKAQSELENALKTKLLTQIPKEFKILDGATRYRVLEQKVDAEADQDGKFGVFTEAQMTIIGFKEDDVKMLLEKRAKRDNGEEFEVRSSELGYGLARADFDKGVLSFPVDYKSVLAKRIDVDELRRNILGKSESELKLTVFALPGLKSATISLWPFYVKTVPTDPAKVKVEVR
jgi:hypothetical protein